jgi:hypothetical protein
MGWTATAAPELAEKLARSPRRDPGIDQSVAIKRHADSLDQLLWCGALEKKPPGTYLERSVNILIGVEGGDHHDGDRVADLWSGEKPSGLDAVDIWHPDVEQTDVWAQRTSESNGFSSVSGLADDLDVGLAAEDCRQSGPDNALIVSDQDPNRHSAVPLRGRVACTLQPRSGFGPAISVPPSRLARSVMPTKP